MAKKQADQVDTSKLQHLLDAFEERIAQQHAIVQEMRTIIGGGASLGVLLKQSEQAFETAWTARYPGKYAWNYGKDRAQMKRLLHLLGPGELADRFGRYLRNDDQFFLKARHSFGAFVASVNQHAQQSTAAVDLELVDAPIGCYHLPPCRDDVEHTQRKMRDLTGSPADKGGPF